MRLLRPTNPKQNLYFSFFPTFYPVAKGRRSSGLLWLRLTELLKYPKLQEKRGGSSWKKGHPVVGPPMVAVAPRPARASWTRDRQRHHS